MFLPFSQIAVATLLGIAGGYYIYRPYFEPVQKSSDQQNQDFILLEHKSI
uniref:Protein PIGBOS1 n=1 Tax=Gasterosteus aculeatus aculeatus TaxID=481459 RepID=A0AAQ4P1D8_GASAC